MLKTKSKFITIFFVIVLFIMTTFVSAVNEITPISVDTENNVSEQNSSNAGTSENNVSDQPIDESTQNEITVDGEAQTTNIKSEDVYLSGKSITIDYLVDGNVFVMSDSLTISSQIAGDVFVCANNVKIEQTSYIYGNLFVCANNVEINGIVYDVYSFSKNITINSGYVYRDIKAVSQNANIFGTIGRNAFISSSSISLTDEENSAKGLIYGDLNYSSPSKIDFPEEIVSGNINYTSINFNNHSNISNYFTSLGCFLIIVIVIWFLGLFIRNRTNLSNSDKKASILKIILAGILGIIIIPLVIFVLMLIPITSTLALLLASIFLLILALSKSVFVIGLNKYICKKLKVNKEIGIFGILIITSIIVWALCLIPYNVGLVISIIMMILGLGIFITSFCSKNSSKDEMNSSNLNNNKNISTGNNSDNIENKKIDKNNKSDDSKKA